MNNDIRETISEQLQQLQMLMHRAAFSHYGMRSPHRGQGRVLAILRLKPEISQKELTYLLNMSKQAVAELISKLEKSGYITREPSTEDKRVMTVKLTEEGEKAAAEIDDGSRETTALDCLDEDELSAFSGYLERIIKSYEEQFPDDEYKQRRQSMEDFMSHHRGHGFDGYDPRMGGRGHGKHRHHRGYPGHGMHRGDFPARDMREGFNSADGFPDSEGFPGFDGQEEKSGHEEEEA